MKRSISIWMGILALIFLAACSTAPVSTPAPTAEELQAEPSETPLVIPTRQPLPPTWTPGSAPPTVTPISGPTRPPVTIEPSPTIPASCDDFAIDENRTSETFVVGQPATLYWQRVAAASGYRIEVYDTAGDVIRVAYIDGSADSFEIPVDVLQVSEEALQLSEMIVFGWEVTPVDEERTQFCPPVSGELIPVMGEGDAASDAGAGDAE